MHVREVFAQFTRNLQNPIIYRVKCQFGQLVCKNKQNLQNPIIYRVKCQFGQLIPLFGQLFFHLDSCFSINQLIIIQLVKCQFGQLDSFFTYIGLGESNINIRGRESMGIYIYCIRGGCMHSVLLSNCPKKGRKAIYNNMLHRSKKPFFICPPSVHFFPCGYNAIYNNMLRFLRKGHFICPQLSTFAPIITLFKNCINMRRHFSIRDNKWAY